MQKLKDILSKIKLPGKRWHFPIGIGIIVLLAVISWAF